MKKHSFKVVVGTVGVGKSTYTNKLAQETHASEIKMDELYKVNPFFDLTVKDRRRWSFTSDVWFLKRRIDFYRALPTMLIDTSVVVDSGIPMSLAYADSRYVMGYYSKEEKRLFHMVAEELLSDELVPDKIIYLKAPFTTIWERIKKRGRDFELAYFTEEYVRQIDQAVERVLKRYLKLGSEIVVMNI